MADVKNNATGASGADGLDDTTGAITMPTMGGSGSGAPSSGLVMWHDAKDQSKPAMATLQQVLGVAKNWYANDPEKFKGVAQLLNAAGYRNNGSAPEVLLQWNKAVTDTVALRGDSMNPVSFLFGEAQSVAAFKAANAKPKGPGAYLGPTSQTQVTNQFDANAIVDNAISQYLGREATEVEKRNFLKQLNTAEKANPQVSTPNGKHSTTLTGGFGSTAANDLAKQTAYGAADYAQTTADTTLMSWFDTAIKTLKSDRIVQ